MASMQRMEPTQAVLANKNGESERAFIVGFSVSDQGRLPIPFTGVSSL